MCSLSLASVLLARVRLRFCLCRAPVRVSFSPPSGCWRSGLASLVCSSGVLLRPCLLCWSGPLVFFSVCRRCCLWRLVLCRPFRLPVLSLCSACACFVGVAWCFLALLPVLSCRAWFVCPVLVGLVWSCWPCLVLSGLSCVLSCLSCPVSSGLVWSCLSVRLSCLVGPVWSGVSCLVSGLVWPCWPCLVLSGLSCVLSVLSGSVVLVVWPGRSGLSWSVCMRVVWYACISCSYFQRKWKINRYGPGSPTHI